MLDSRNLEQIVLLFYNFHFLFIPGNCSNCPFLPVVFASLPSWEERMILGVKCNGKAHFLGIAANNVIKYCSISYFHFMTFTVSLRCLFHIGCRWWRKETRKLYLLRIQNMLSSYSYTNLSIFWKCKWTNTKQLLSNDVRIWKSWKPAKNFVSAC